MRVLWIKVGGLWPPNTGGRLRTCELLSALSADHRITVVTSHGPHDDAEGLRVRLPRLDAMISVPYRAPKHGTARFAGALARSWLSSEPVDLWRWRVPAVARAAADLLRSGEWDVVVADFLVSVPNVPRTRTPVVYFAHNVEFRIWQRLAAVERRALKRLALAIEWRKVRAREARTVRDVAMTIAVSDGDAASLASLAPGASVGAVATGVDTEWFRPAGSGVPGRVVFCGSMDWYPNEDAVLDFGQHVWPRLRDRHPDATFVIVGRNPGPRVTALSRVPGISVTGTVPDVRPFVADAAVCVVPLRVGGGTRIKIFEALAMEKAVVSTAIGAEGLGLADAVHFWQADGPDAMVAAIDALLRDHAMAARLGAAGRALVETRYSWRSAAAQFTRHLESVVGLAGPAVLSLRSPAAS